MMKFALNMVNCVFKMTIFVLKMTIFNSCAQNWDCGEGTLSTGLPDPNPWLIDGSQQAVGSFVEFSFGAAFGAAWVTGMSFAPRRDREQRFGSVRLVFSDGSIQLVQLADDTDAHMYELNPVLTTSVKIVGASVYANAVRPGALEVWFRAGTARENECVFHTKSDECSTENDDFVLTKC